MNAQPKTVRDTVEYYERTRDQMFTLIVLHLEKLAQNPAHVVSPIDFNHFKLVAETLGVFKELCDRTVKELSQP